MDEHYDILQAGKAHLNKYGQYNDKIPPCIVMCLDDIVEERTKVTPKALQLFQIDQVS